MKINIKEQYNNRVSKVLGNDIPPKWEKYFSEKEICMWYFTSVLIKGNPEQAIYDSNNKEDVDELQDILDIYMLTGYEKFTLQEWFDYMSQD